MPNIMVDLETLGTRPGCSILSIGAVAFGPRGLGQEFYVVVNRASCKNFGLHEDPSTIEWWSKQSRDAAAVVEEATVSGVQLPMALTLFNAFITTVDHRVTKVGMWGNGADFDNVILEAAYRATGIKRAWGLYNNRCYRTFKALRPDMKIRRSEGVHHNALADAKNQASHMLELIKAGPTAFNLKDLLA